MKNCLLVICLLISLGLYAQRGKKREYLIFMDTVNVILCDARVQKYPYIEKNPQYYSDTIVKRRFFADGSSDERSYYYGSNPFMYNRISFDEKTNSYTLYPAYEGFVPQKAHFTFNSNLTTGWVNRLPKRQNEYRQNLFPNDIFSWSEPINTTYDPYTILRPSFGTYNSLTYYMPLFKVALLDLRYTNTTNKGIIPIASSITNDFRLGISDIPVSWLGKAKVGLKSIYSETYNKLAENGSNHARLFYNIVTTPPDFDNSRGGYSGGKAYTNVDSSEHRYSISVDNPYRYIDNSLDEETLRRISTIFSLTNESWNWCVGYDYDRQHIRSGIMPYVQNMIDNFNGRKEALKVLHSKLQYKNKFFDKKPYYELNQWQKILYSTLYVNYNFNAVNYNADYTHVDNLSLNRVTNDLGVSWQNERSEHNVHYNFWLNANNSNTLSKPKISLSEGLNVAFRLDKLLEDIFWDFNPRLKLYYSLSHTQNEAPLYYAQPHYASTLLNVEDFRDYREQYPLYRLSGLNTETTFHNEIGIDFSCFWHPNLGSFRVNYFWNNTKRGILPVYQNNRFEVCNAVEWNKEGWEITYGHSGCTYNFNWNVDANFTSYITLVKRLLVNDDRILLAGFSDVSISVLEGQPYGVIYGQKIDGSMGVIGNPTPDFVLNLNLGLGWKEWSFTCSTGYVRGGDCWNGTLNTMNYLGVSEQSAKDRTAQTPFDSPYYSKGMTGIAEEAIEDASTVRIHNISLSYDLSRYVEIPQLKLSLGVNNLILWSAYSGVDAARPLFGYAVAKGLDYFNMPGVTNATFAITMKF